MCLISQIVNESKKMVETSGRATEEGSLFQDGQTCNRCHVYKQDQHIECTVIHITKWKSIFQYAGFTSLNGIILQQRTREMCKRGRMLLYCADYWFKHATSCLFFMPSLKFTGNVWVHFILGMVVCVLIWGTFSNTTGSTCNVSIS